INENGVTVEHTFERGFRRWEDIIRVVANGDYGYIYSGADRATIIPRRCFHDGDEVPFRAFMKAAIIYHWEREHVAKATAEQAAAEAAALAKAQRETGEPSPIVALSKPDSEPGESDTQWSRAALKNIDPSGAAVEATWY